MCCKQDDLSIEGRVLKTWYADMLLYLDIDPITLVYDLDLAILTMYLYTKNQGCPQDVRSQDRDETDTFQKRIETAVSQCKTPTGEVCHLTTCFLRVRSIIFFVIYLQAWCIAWMFTRLKSRDRDRDVNYIFKTETKPRRSIFPNSRDRDETRRSKNVSRPSRDRAVEDRDYIPAKNELSGSRLSKVRAL